MKLEIKSTADISVEELEKLNHQHPMGKVVIRDKALYPKGKVYSIEDMLLIKREIEGFLKNCPERDPNNPDSEKKIFAYIYTKIAYLIQEDDLALDIAQNGDQFFKSYANKYLSDANGLSGALLLRKTTQAGYLETLRNLLSEKGIQIENVVGMIISGKTGKYVSRVWNRVKLDGSLYNCDILGDRQFVREGLMAPYFLKSDEDFEHYKSYELATYRLTETSKTSVSQEKQYEMVSESLSQIDAELDAKEAEKRKGKGFFREILNKLKSLKKDEVQTINLGE